MEEKFNVRDVNGAIKAEDEKLQKKLTQYFEQLLNVDERGEV